MGQFHQLDASYSEVEESQALHLARDESEVEGRSMEGHKPNTAVGKHLNFEEPQRQLGLDKVAEIEQLYAAIVQNVQIGVYVWHLVEPEDARSLRLVASNPIAALMVNRSTEALIGKSILECFPNLLQAEVELIAQVARSGKPQVIPESRYIDDRIAAIYASKIFPLPHGCVGVAFENITERKQAEANLRERERQFATLARLSPVGIFRIDAFGQDLYFNQRMSELTGFSLENLFESGWTAALHPNDRERVVWELQQAMEVEEGFSTECRFLHADGKIVWVIGQAFPERLDSGEVVGYVGTVTDITDRKQIEQALQENQQRYATLARMSPVGIFKTDPQGGLLYVNDRWMEISGLSSSEARGSGWRRSIHPEDREWVAASWYRYVQARLPFRAEFRFQRPDGTCTWVVAQAVPELLDTDEMIGYVGSVTDISDRKQAEQSLQESEYRYATLSEISPVGIFRTDNAGNNIYVNDRWREFTGLSEQEGMGKGWHQAIHPDDRPKLIQVWDNIEENPVPLQAEYRYVRPDGVDTWVFCQAVPEFQPDGKLKSYVGTVTDITDRKRAEVALQERADELSQVNLLLTRTTTLLEDRNRELDQFAYVASHDLKAPLRAIANLSEWIEEDLADKLPEENQRQMHLLRGRVHRMEALINGLLQYSRVGRTQVSTETIEVSALLHEVIDSLAPPDSFKVEVADNMPTVTTKSLLLRQVFANLIGNAIKHHPRLDGHVSITVQDLGSMYEFRVADDGQGIAPEHHEKIFAIFHTLESRDTKESTGIGLSIVKKIVEAEGGFIHVDSQLGVGTTFRFTWHKRSS